METELEELKDNMAQILAFKGLKGLKLTKD